MKFTMKFNPYAALLVTGALMLVTVVLSPMGSNAALLKAGAASVDRDVSRFAAKTFPSLAGRTEEANVGPEDGTDRAEKANERAAEARDRGESRARVAFLNDPANEPAPADGAPSRHAAERRSF